MFGLFKKKRPLPPEKLFGSRRALLAYVESLLADEGAVPVLVCAFELSLSSLEVELTGRSCSRAARGSALLEAIRSYPPGAPAITATEATLHEAVDLAGPGLPPVRFLALERHPLRVHDDAVEALAGKLANGSSVTFLLSLDDPFFTRLGGNLKGLMEKLGVGDEAIEHAFVSKAIANAQEKIARAVPREAPARSAEEWYQANRVRS